MLGSIRMVVAGLSLMASGAVAFAAEDLIEAGEALYNANCATCHGEGLRNPGSSFDLKQLRENERPRFNTSVLGGKGQMPPWKGVLTPEEFDALWAYIRANADT